MEEEKTKAIIIAFYQDHSCRGIEISDTLSLSKSKDTIINFLKSNHSMERGCLWFERYEYNDDDYVKNLKNKENNKSYIVEYGWDLRNYLSEKSTLTHSIPAYDAMHCIYEDIDMFSEEYQHDKLLQCSAYNYLMFNTAISKLDTTYRALDTGKGVLLYDLRQLAGKEAYESVLQYCADHYFDKDFDLERLHLYDVPPILNQKEIETHPLALNFNFNHYDKDFTFSDLIKKVVLNEKSVPVKALVAEYDMSPTSECYTRFVTNEGLQVHPHTQTFQIALLNHIATHGLPPDRFSNEWKFIFPHLNTFSELKERMQNCSSWQEEKQIVQESMELAERVLKEDYPDRRNTNIPSYYIDISSESNTQSRKL